MFTQIGNMPPASTSWNVRCAPMARVAAGGYSSSEVCALAGCTYRQLDHWCRTGRIAASIAAGAGQGSRRRFSAADVATARRLVAASAICRRTLDDVYATVTS